MALDGEAACVGDAKTVDAKTVDDSTGMEVADVGVEDTASDVLLNDAMLEVEVGKMTEDEDSLAEDVEPLAVGVEL